MAQEKTIKKVNVTISIHLQTIHGLDEFKDIEGMGEPEFTSNPSDIVVTEENKSDYAKFQKSILDDFVVPAWFRQIIPISEQAVTVRDIATDSSVIKPTVIRMTTFSEIKGEGKGLLHPTMKGKKTSHFKTILPDFTPAGKGSSRWTDLLPAFKNQINTDFEMECNYPRISHVIHANLTFELELDEPLVIQSNDPKEIYNAVSAGTRKALEDRRGVIQPNELQSLSFTISSSGNLCDDNRLVWQQKSPASELETTETDRATQLIFKSQVASMLQTDSINSFFVAASACLRNFYPQGTLFNSFSFGFSRGDQMAFYVPRPIYDKAQYTLAVISKPGFQYQSDPIALAEQLEIIAHDCKKQQKPAGDSGISTDWQLFIQRLETIADCVRRHDEFVSECQDDRGPELK